MENKDFTKSILIHVHCAAQPACTFAAVLQLLCSTMHVQVEDVSTYCSILQRVHAYKMDERENDKINRLFLQ